MLHHHPQLPCSRRLTPLPRQMNPSWRHLPRTHHRQPDLSWGRRPAAQRQPTKCRRALPAPPAVCRKKPAACLIQWCARPGHRPRYQPLHRRDHLWKPRAQSRCPHLAQNPTLEACALHVPRSGKPKSVRKSAKNAVSGKSGKSDATKTTRTKTNVVRVTDTHHAQPACHRRSRIAWPPRC